MPLLATLRASPCRGHMQTSTEALRGANHTGLLGLTQAQILGLGKVGGPGSLREGPASPPFVLPLCLLSHPIILLCS